jgi:hypothetical protein
MKNFKKGITIFFLTALFFIPFLVSKVNAQEELFFGQYHYYSVVFRGNREGIVYAKIVLSNPDEEPLEEISFEIPNISPSELIMYQIELPPVCVQYDYSSEIAPDGQYKCLEYEDPDYRNPYYSSYYRNEKRAEYSRITFTQSGNLFKVTLPKPIEEFKMGAILVAYTTKDYVKESTGMYKFEFETIKVPFRVQETKVTIDVDADLILKGKKSEVNYSTGNIALLSEAGAKDSFSSTAIDSVVSNIGSYGALIKETSNLAPNESFIVKGEYATSWFRLYLQSIVISIVIVAMVVVGLELLVRSSKGKKKVETLGNNKTENNTVKEEEVIHHNIQDIKNTLPFFSTTHIIASLLSSTLVVVLVLLIQFITEAQLLGTLFHDTTLVLVASVIFIIAMFLLFFLFIFGPAVYVATKHGWKSFLMVLFMQFLWFVLFLILYIAFFQSTSLNDFGPIYPLEQVMF